MRHFGQPNRHGDLKRRGRHRRHRRARRASSYRQPLPRPPHPLAPLAVTLRGPQYRPCPALRWSRPWRARSHWSLIHSSVVGMAFSCNRGGLGGPSVRGRRPFQAQARGWPGRGSDLGVAEEVAPLPHPHPGSRPLATTRHALDPHRHRSGSRTSAVSARRLAAKAPRSSPGRDRSGGTAKDRVAVLWRGPQFSRSPVPPLQPAEMAKIFWADRVVTPNSPPASLLGEGQPCRGASSRP